MQKVVIGDATLYCGDCMDIMPTLGKVDAVVTDPPYGLGEPSGTISKKRSHKREYNQYEDTKENLISNILPRFIKSLELSNGLGVVTTGGKNCFEYPKPECIGFLYQPASCGMCTWGRATCQPVLFYGRDPKIGKTIQPIHFQTTEAASEKEHPCAKPIKATRWMVDRASVENHVILDPFMGSGTTGVACLQMGRKFIGIEKDTDYFKIACERIQREHNQLKLF